MKWVLIVIGLFTEKPFLSVSSYSTLAECHYTGERIAREYKRTFVGEMDLKGWSPVNFSCQPSTGERPPTCGLDDLAACQ